MREICDESFFFSFARKQIVRKANSVSGVAVAGTNGWLLRILDQSMFEVEALKHKCKNQKQMLKLKSEISLKDKQNRESTSNRKPEASAVAALSMA